MLRLFFDRIAERMRERGLCPVAPEPAVPWLSTGRGRDGDAGQKAAAEALRRARGKRGYNDAEPRRRQTCPRVRRVMKEKSRH